MYAVGSLIGGSAAARSAIFFYALALHAVIFLILARCVGGCEQRPFFQTTKKQQKSNNALLCSAGG